jgi:hypothetical protein
MTSMVHLGVKKTSQDVNVNVKPITNVNITTAPVREESSVAYPDPVNPYTIDEVEELKNEVTLLKLYIDMLQNNPLIVNKYIIVDDEKLIQFVKLLTGADDVQIDADDVGQGCLSSKSYRKVHNIYVNIKGQTQNLKYDFPRAMKELSDLRISTKFVW